MGLCIALSGLGVFVFIYPGLRPGLYMCRAYRPFLGIISPKVETYNASKLIEIALARRCEQMNL